jgi:hypothetical protein
MNFTGISLLILGALPCWPEILIFLFGILVFVLCLADRSQLENLGVRPFTRYLKRRRAEALSRTFPRYDPLIVEAFSRTDDIMKST